MHHIYHTEGIILGSRNFREADKYYYIFTRDLGMVYASAQGVRKISSKLRFILQDFTYIKVDLLQGRDFWRITSASKTNKLETLCKKRETFQIILNIFALFRRLLVGVEKNEELFVDLINGLSVLEKTASEEDYLNIEAIIVLRALNNLGYIGGGAIQNFIRSPFEDNLIFEASKSRAQMLKQINKALRETHL